MSGQRILHCMLACLVAAMSSGWGVVAAQPAAPKSTGGATPPRAVARASTTVDDAARKAEILGSQQWRRVMFELSEWLATQKIYDQAQVAKIKSDFNLKVHNMSAGELQLMLADMEAKFQILETSEAQDARAWLAQYLSLLADKKREEIIGKLPNLATMTSDQLRQEIAVIQERRAAMDRQQSAVNQLRNSDPNPWTQSTKMAQQAYIRDHTATASSYSSPYRAPSGKRPFEDFKVGPDVGYYVGAYGGFGMTFGSGF